MNIAPETLGISWAIRIMTMFGLLFSVLENATRKCLLDPTQGRRLDARRTNHVIRKLGL